VPFNVGKVGQVAASRHPIFVKDVAAQNDWVVRTDWAKREEIRSFASHPLIFRDKLLGVVAVFSRQPLGQEEFTWLGLFANQAAVAIANACTEEALRSSERNLVAFVNTIPTAAWTTRPDGYCDFLNQVWLDYAGMTAEQAQGWGWAEAIHPDDRTKLVEEWQSCLASGTPVDTEARIRRFDSSYRWFLIRGNPLRDESGSILKWCGTCVDIDDRKRGEEALHARELDARSLLDSMPGFLARLSPDGTPEIFNRPFLQYLGKTVEETRKWKTSDVIHPDDLAHAIEVFGNGVSGGQPWGLEFRLRRLDGIYRWFQTRWVPVRDVEGRILHWNALTTDIDDRKKAEEALQSSERNLKLMINAIPTYIHVLNTDGSVQYVNRAVLDYMGITLDDTQKEDYRALFFHPEDVERLRAERREALLRPIPFENEQRVLGKDGKYRWFLIRYNPLLDEQGRIDRWYVAATDIDDRKKAEEALQSSERNLSLMINVIPTFIGVLRTDGLVVYVNQTVLDYTGITVEDVERGEFRSRIHHPEDIERLREERRAALARPVPFENEQRMLGKDGKYRWFLFRYNPLLDEQGRIERWYVAAFDIEDRKRAEEALQSNERNLSVMINTIPALIHTGRPDGYLDYFNRRWLEYLGTPLENMEGWNWTGVIHPDDVEGIVNMWRTCLASGKVFEHECRVRRADGEYRWMFHCKVPLRDATGKILKWYGSSVDIDDRKKSESRLRQVIDTIPTLAWTMLPDGSNEFLSKRWEEYTGLSVDESHGWGWQAAFHPDDLPALLKKWQQLLASGQAGEQEARLRYHDGVYRWFLIRVEPFRDETGKIRRWYGTSTDIDDRKRAENALQSNERNLGLIINTIPTLAWSAAPDGAVDFVNQRWLEYTGFSPEQGLGWGWTAAIHPDDLNRIAEYWRLIMRTGEPGEMEARFRRFDGVYRWFLFRGNALRDESGTIVKWYGTNTDIDDRKRAEAQVEQAYLRLTEAQRVSKTGSFITDLVADEHNFSDEAFRIFEFDPAAKVTFQMCRDTIHPEDQPTFDAVIARAMTGTDVEFGFRIVTSRGAVKHLRGMARVMGQSAGHPVFIGALQDVTESKLAEEALNRARSELAHVTRITTLNALTASIAHEINQPLSGIVSNASASLRFLAGDATNLEEAREAVRDIVRDGKRAGEIITRIRALAKRTATRREKLDLNETISEVLAIIGDEAKRNNVIVRTQFADALSPVAGDRVQLQQVVLNLVMNAIEAMSSVSDRPRELIITTQNIDAGCVQATVEDSGTGITSEAVDKIFDSFYTTKAGGMGMGLSISRSILQSHGGRLWAVGKDAPGTMFHFTVPKYHEEGSHAPATGT